MRIKVYQINKDKDKNRKAFEPFDGSSVDSSIYKNVFYGDVNTENLEDVFRILNADIPGTFHGRSLSVSDVIEICRDDFENAGIEAGNFYCDSIGFKSVEFDSSKCEDMEGMRVLYVAPHHTPVDTRIGSDYESLSRAVGGLIEPVYEYDDVMIVGNEESKIYGMDGNRRLESGSILAGPFFLCGDNGEDFIGLTDEQADKYMKRFAKPENISDEEVIADSGFTIISM